MADSQGKTGEEIIQAIGKAALLEFYTTKDIARDIQEATRRLQDTKTSNRDFVSLLRLIWDFTIKKPTQSVGLESDMPIQITINEGIIEDGKKH